MDSIIVYWQLEDRIFHSFDTCWLSTPGPLLNLGDPAVNKTPSNHSFSVCQNLAERDRQKAKQVKRKKLLYNKMVNFMCQLDWVMRLTRYLVKCYSGCFCGGVFGWGSHLSLETEKSKVTSPVWVGLTQLIEGRNGSQRPTQHSPSKTSPPANCLQTGKSALSCIQDQNKTLALPGSSPASLWTGPTPPALLGLPVATHPVDLGTCQSP